MFTLSNKVKKRDRNYATEVENKCRKVDAYIWGFRYNGYNRTMDKI